MRRALCAALLALALLASGCGPDRMGGQGGSSPIEPTLFPAGSFAAGGEQSHSGAESE
ncbi:MAG: hypothetical protein DIU80_020820 [Chloroflexota bacterium]